MELRHLRYFVAVAEEGSFTQAAEKRLHTAQPSLSRQIRDLEDDIGAKLIDRGPRGMELTAAGRVFLDHARMVLRQVEVAAEAARRAARPAKVPFSVGFLSGHEIEWLPRVMEILRDELGTMELIVHSASSPDLQHALEKGTMDAAFLRPDPTTARGLVFHPVMDELLFVLMPAGHRLAARRTIRPQDLVGETFVNFRLDYAPVLRHVIDAYFARLKLDIPTAHEAEGLPMAISLLLATGGVTLLPAYTLPLLPPTVTSRPLGGAPTVPLALGYNPVNVTAMLKLFLERAEGFIGKAET